MPARRYDVVLAVDELDPAALSGLLRHSEATRGAAVLSVERHPVGTGQVGSCVELLLVVEGIDSPVAIVDKGPSDNPISLSTAAGLHLYEREVCFYVEVAATVGITTPCCHAASYDAASGRFLLLMESLSPTAPTDQLEGLSLLWAERAVRELAALHAPHWDSPALGPRTFVHSEPDGDVLDPIEFLPSLFIGFLERYGDALTKPARAVVEWLVLRLPSYVAGRSGPKTIIHGDFRTDNLLFDGRAGAVPMATVDWQMAGVGSAALDLAYLLTTSLDIEDRRRHEATLLAAYHDRLCELGVAGYDTAALLDDYAWHAFQGVVMLVCAAMLVERTDRGDAMFLTMIERSAAAVDDLDARPRLEP